MTKCQLQPYLFGMGYFSKESQARVVRTKFSYSQRSFVHTAVLSYPQNKIRAIRQTSLMSGGSAILF